MSTNQGTAEPGGNPLRVPHAQELQDWPVLPCPRAPRDRDVPLDLLRGLAMLFLVVNHTNLQSWLTTATGGVLSAAETLVPISGVAVGMVFGDRWVREGGREVTRQLLARARTIYLAAFTLSAIVGLSQVIPALATESATTTPQGLALYARDGLPETALAVATLSATPWQTSILAFFVLTLLLTPLGLRALAAGRCRGLVFTSVAVYLLGRGLDVAVLPSRSEGPFPLLVWQVLFFPALAVGFHRARLTAALRPVRGPVQSGIAVLAIAAVSLQIGLAPDVVLRWQEARFDKATLDPLRLIVMLSIALALYGLLRRNPGSSERTLGWLLLPLGRNSLYVFLVHAPLGVVLATCLTLAGAPGGIGQFGNSLLSALLVAAIVWLVRREALFRWIPR